MDVLQVFKEEEELVERSDDIGSRGEETLQPAKGDSLKDKDFDSDGGDESTEESLKNNRVLMSTNTTVNGWRNATNSTQNSIKEPKLRREVRSKSCLAVNQSH